MTTRRDAAERAHHLTVDLQAEISRGKLAPGDQIPAATVLSRRYHLSRPTALKALQPLIDDGTLRVVPSVGIFVAEPNGMRSGCYVLLVRTATSYWLGHAAVRGFEERITQRGGRSIVMDVRTFLDPAMRSDVAPVLGVFTFTDGAVTETVRSVEPTVPITSYLAGNEPAPPGEDGHLTHVDLDNVSGGSLAASELLRDGHHDVMFVGLHIDDEPHFPWSRQRAEGWAATVRRHNPRSSLTRVQPAHHDQRKAIRLAAAAAVEPALDHRACVGADDLVLVALAEELSSRGVPTDRWPVMVGFEGLPEAAGLVTTSVRPRWEDLGAKAADHLFDASRGRPRTNGSLALASMSIVSRPFVVTRAR